MNASAASAPLNDRPSDTASDPGRDTRAWFHGARYTYAVIDGLALPQADAMLDAAGTAEWGRLPRGAPPYDAVDAWLVQLAPDLHLSHWLLLGDGARVANWGAIVSSDAPFREVRQHLRGLMEAQLPSGQNMVLRWYRPLVLRTLLPLCSPSQLLEFFGPVRAFAVMSGNEWHWLRQLGGKLDLHTVRREPAAV